MTKVLLVEPPQPQVLLAKNPKPKLVVLIGDDYQQVRFTQRLMLAEFSNLEIKEVDSLTDEDIRTVKRPTLWIVSSDRALREVAEDTLGKIMVISAGSIKRRSSASNQLVKFAADLLGYEKPSKELIASVSERIAQEGNTTSVEGLIVDAMNLLEDRKVVVNEREEKTYEPWVNANNWRRKGEEVYPRLSRLYKDMVAYVYALDGNWTAAKLMGVTPAKFAWLKSLSLDNNKVDDTIVVLSRWKNQQIPNDVCFLLVSVIWKRM